MEKIKHEKSAGAVVYYFNQESREPYFLLLKYTNYWGFAKGIIEESEESKETALREIKEETGFDGELVPGFEEKQIWFFRLKNELINKEAVYFLVRIKKENKDKVKISFEHEDFKWLKKDEALELMKIKANKEMIERAYKFILEFEKQKRLFE